MFSFQYDIPTKIYFGPNQLGKLGSELKKFGSRVLMVYGGGSIKKNGLYDRTMQEIRNAGLECFELSGVEPNPKVTSVYEGAEICRKENIDVVLPIGGGSVIDCAKVVAAATFYDGDAWDFAIKKAAVGKCLPIVAISTMAATGSEMNDVGVISNVETKQKCGVHGQALRPKVTFMDPTLTYSVGKYQTACGSADILSHIMEDYLVDPDESMFMLDRMREGMMKTVIHYAPIALAEPDHYEARANLMWASVWAINGFSSALRKCVWSNHKVEHEMSAIYDITHGLGLAIITPKWMKYILDDTTAPKLRDFAVNVFDVDASLPVMDAAKAGIRCLEHFLYDTLGLASTLTEVGIGEENIDRMAEKACNGKPELNGWRPLKAEQIAEILRACL